MDISKLDLEKIFQLATQFGLKILGAIALLIAGFWLAKILKVATIRSLTKARADDTLTKFAGNVAKWLVLLLIGVSILGILGIQTTSFAAIIAASGLAIGLAFQGTLSNVAAGVMLLIFRPFKVGQFVKIAGEAGTVFEISLFTTSINTPDNRHIILPNSTIFGSKIENVSHNPTRRIDITVGCGYQSSLDETRRVLNNVIEETEGVLSDPPPAVVLTCLNDSSVDWTTRCWVKSEDFFAIQEQLLVNLKNGLDRNKIEIPYPQMDVHVSSTTQQPS